MGKKVQRGVADGPIRCGLRKEAKSAQALYSVEHEDDVQWKIQAPGLSATKRMSE
jgi:hypothetical protein